MYGIDTYFPGRVGRRGGWAPSYCVDAIECFQSQAVQRIVSVDGSIDCAMRCFTNLALRVDTMMEGDGG